MMSKQSLIKTAHSLNYKPENLEKVYQLLFVLDQFASVPYLKERLVLKGGTALNLFHLHPVPRLSVDIDLNYIGQIERDEMLKERKIIEDAINQILIQNQFELYRNPTQHAGGKNVWSYNSVLGQKGNLEIDLNFMFRKPFWPVVHLNPKLDLDFSFKTPVLDIHEIAAGKLAALFARRVSRDFFDAHQLFSNCQFEQHKLRETFIVYACVSNTLLEDISIDSVNYDMRDIRNKLFPVLKQEGISRKKSDLEHWANSLLSELRSKLSILLPLQQNEIDFIRLIREQGEIKPELISENKNFIEVVNIHPLVNWKAKKAKES